MAVALTTPPAPYSFSKNHIEIGFTSNNYLDQVGVAAVGDLGIANAIPAGTVISFKYGSTVVNMTAAAAPDNSGNQFPSGTVYNQAYIDSLLPYFKANHLLSRDFDIVPAGTSYRFNAKKKSNGFDLVPVTGPGFLITLVTPGQPEKVKPGFSIYFELYAQNDDHSAYEKVIATNIPLKPGAGGMATVDIASYLHSFFETAVDKIPVDFPDPASPAALLCTKSCRKYYFRYAEMWSNQVQKVSESAKYTVLYGGLSYTGAFKFTLSSLFVPAAGDPSKDRFLKQGNAQVYTRTNQPQYLSFFNTRATANGAKLKAKYYFTDGSAALTETKSTFNLEQYRKYGFNTRFDVLYSGTKTVERYEIWLESSTGAKLSEIRTYWLNYEIREFVRYFINNSSWGGLDTLLCYGKGNSEFERSQQTANRIRRAGQDIKTGDRTVFDIKINEQFEVATGWMSKTDLANSRDFFLSKFTYRYVGGLTLPIEISSKNIPETEDGVNRYARLFEYRYLFDDHSYTEGDVEDPGTGFDGFFFHNSNPVNPTGGIQEVDPTVPSWVKSITVADIQRWNSGGTVVGEHLHEMADVSGLQAALDGKASLVHGHIIGDIAGLQAALNGKAPSAHSHVIDDVTGLQAALNGKLSGSPNDWIKNQSGLQASAQFHVAKGRVTSELYIPSSGLSSGQKARIKFALSAGSGGEAPPPPLTSVSFSQIAGIWSDNASLAGAINAKAALSHTHPISAITDLETILNGKAASSHTHTIANISGLQDALDGKVSGTADNFIKNQSALQPDAQFHVIKARVATELYIPATGLTSGQKARIKFALSAGSGGEAPPPPLTSVSFSQITGIWSDNASLVAAMNGKAALSHTHPLSDITGLQEALDGKAPGSHTHAIANITGLQTALDGKAASSHTHTIANITGLQTALDAKVTGTANDWIKNQSGLQASAQFHVTKARVTSELYIPSSGLGSGQKARIKFSLSAGSGGEAPPPPLTSVAWGDITGSLSAQADLMAALNGYFPRTMGVDLDTRKTSGWVTIVGGHASNPFAGTGSSGFASFESTNWGWQLIGADGGVFNLKGRILNSGSWGAWYTIYHSGIFNPSDYLSKAGGTMTGGIVMPKNVYAAVGGVLNMNNSDITGMNALYFGDETESGEGIAFPKNSSIDYGAGTSGWDILRGYRGKLYWPGEIRIGDLANTNDSAFATERLVSSVAYTASFGVTINGGSYMRSGAGTNVKLLYLVNNDAFPSYSPDDGATRHEIYHKGRISNLKADLGFTTTLSIATLTGSSADFSGIVRSTGAANVPVTGKGVEIEYNGGDYGRIIAYDRGTSTWKNLILNSGGGNVGIGTAAPTEVQEVSKSIAAQVVTKYSNLNTGFTSTNGFIVGIESAGNGIIWNRGNNFIRIGTNGIERGRFSPTGTLLLGTTIDAPNSKIVTSDVLSVGSAVDLQIANSMRLAGVIIMHEQANYLNQGAFEFNSGGLDISAFKAGVSGRSINMLSPTCFNPAYNSASVDTANGGVLIGRNSSGVYFTGRSTGGTDNFVIRNYVAASGSQFDLNLGGANINGQVTVTGNILSSGNVIFANALQIKDGNGTWDVIKKFGSDVNGAGVAIGSGSCVIVGAGESAAVVSANITHSTEQLFLASDGAIEFYTNLQSGWASRKSAMVLGANGGVTVPIALYIPSSGLAAGQKVRIKFKTA